MRRNIMAFGTLATLTLAACSPAEIVVTAQIEQRGATEEETTQTLSLSGLEVHLIPFDRDFVFDSLTEAAETPEPPIPDDLLEAREQIRDAQERWQQLETRWNTLRDRLQNISDELEQYNRGEGRYQVLFREFGDVEAEYNRVDRQVQGAFARFDSLQKASVQRSQEIRVQQDNWAEDAFADIGEVFAAKVQEAGRDVLVDTTNAQGIATFRSDGPKPGPWWVHARYELPFTELYWNVPVTLERGEVVEVTLSRENAEVRPSL